MVHFQINISHHRSHFERFLRPLERTKLLRIRIYLKFLNCLTLSALYICRSNLNHVLTFPYVSRRVARNSQLGGCFGGLAAAPLLAGDHWRSGSKAPSRRRLVIWGQRLQPPMARGSGGGAPNAQKVCIFLQK